MKKILTATFVLLAIVTGCTGPYEERIKTLDEQITELEIQLARQNETIVSLYTVLNVLNSRDVITGITQLDNNAGYVVHFSKHEDIVIYHGIDANVPRVGVKRNPDDGNYYWTIQYGSGEVQYIINEEGNMVPAVGVVPLLKIENGKFYISYDSRKTWQYLGEADGVGGDEIFKRIIVTADYVTFVTAEEEFKIPTNTLVQNMYQDASVTNTNLTALTLLINKLSAAAVCVTSVSDYMRDGEVAGSVIKLSSGDSVIIRDWVYSASPAIIADKAEDDSVYFWAMCFTDSTREWILDADGNRVAATGVAIEIPVVTPVLDTIDNTWYWNVVAAGDTTLLLDTDGHKVPVMSNAGEFSVFRRMDNSNADYLLLYLADGSQLKIPKIYTIAFTSDALTGNTLTMAPSSNKTVNYRVYGADANSQYTILTQGGVSAFRTPSSTDVGAGTITVITGSGFSGNGKVLLLVSAGDGSPKTMTKSITVALGD